MRAWLLVLLCWSGCVAYNEPCTPLVDNPNEVVAFVGKGTELFLDRPNVRHANNAFGQQAADAFVWVFRDTATPAAFGIVNSGAVRAEGLCGVTRNIVREGPLTNGVVHEILFFQNTVASVDLSEADILAVFEQSASRLFTAPAPIMVPSSGFLQVSREVELSVDCARPAGMRVTSLRIGGQAISVTAPKPLTQARYRVALSTFVLSGADGFRVLAGKADDPDRRFVPALRFGGIDNDITAAYLRQSPSNRTVEDGFRVEPRIAFTNCSVPSRPTN